MLCGFQSTSKTAGPNAVPSTHAGKSRIAGFQTGGDDFLAKPYDIIEPELRIEARIRKNEQVFFSDIMRFGDLCIDENRRLITYGDKTGEFTAQQFDIIAFLARNPEKVFSCEQLYDRIWREPILKSRHNLQVPVVTVRQKSDRPCAGKQYIRTAARKDCYFAPNDVQGSKTDEKNVLYFIKKRFLPEGGNRYARFSFI